MAEVQKLFCPSLGTKAVEMMQFLKWGHLKEKILQFFQTILKNMDGHKGILGHLTCKNV